MKDNKMRRVLYLIGIVVIGLSVWNPLAVNGAQRCFDETGFCIDGRIREYWEQNGGLVVFGYPIGPEEQTTIEGGTYTVQRFERNRLELHPENARPYDVLLGRLGANRLLQQQRDWFTFAKNGDTGGCMVYAETGHAVCGAFLQAFRAHGLNLDTKKTISNAESLALFGLPLSDAQVETLSDGNQYLVQWFERARFEYHPENQAPYDILFGLLGSETEAFNNQPKPTSTPAPMLTRIPTATTSPYLPAATLDTFRTQMPLGGSWSAGSAGKAVIVQDIFYGVADGMYKYVTFRTLGRNFTGGSDSVGSATVIDLEGNYGTFVSYKGCYSECQKGETWVFLIPANSAPAQIIAVMDGTRFVVELRVWPR
jgi:hypothetical protein